MWLLVNGTCISSPAGWCEGFYGDRVSEALAACVVIVPFLLLVDLFVLVVEFYSTLSDQITVTASKV